MLKQREMENSCLWHWCTCNGTEKKGKTKFEIMSFMYLVLVNSDVKHIKLWDS